MDSDISSIGLVSKPQPAPAGPFTPATLTVTANGTGTIGPAFAGLSYEKFWLYQPLFTQANTNLAGIFRRLGASILRIGGNSTDQNTWTPNGAGQIAGQIAPSDVASAAAFVKATGWQCLYSVNLGGSASGATTPALAAAEVAYAASQFGGSLYGVEIGNECDLYGSSYYAGNWSLAQFQALWEQYRSAILARTPDVPIIGPASAFNESTWTVPFGEAVGNKISLLTQHYYRGDGLLPGATIDFLLSPDTALKADLEILNNGAKNIGIPFRMAECNSYFHAGAPGVSNSYASSLWIIDYLFDCARGGAAGVNFHGGGNGPGYTPIANSSGTVIGVRPEFYGILLFTLAGQGRLYATELNADSLNASAYAVRTASGGLNLIINNKDPIQNLQLSAQLPMNIERATVIEMKQLSTGAQSPTLTATAGVTIQGAAVNPDGTFSPRSAYAIPFRASQLRCHVPALSAVLIEVL
jgi:hypothetical protein